MLLTSSLIALGTSVRCVFLVFPALSESDFTLLCHLGALLNGIPSIVVTSAPPAVSAAWFPPSERVTATSISQMLNNLGTGLREGFILFASAKVWTWSDFSKGP